MLKKIYIFISSIVLYLFNTSIVIAQTAPRPLDASEPSTIQDFMDVFANTVASIVIIAGFASFIVLIFGGFRYLTAQGDPKATASARGIVTWAIVGLAFIIIAWLIIKFIADFTGLPLTTFCLPRVFPGSATVLCPGLSF